MLYKTRAIILSIINYSDNYSIIYTLTEEFGTNSYLIRKNTRKKFSNYYLFHPFAILDLEVEHKKLRKIQLIKEAKIHFYCFSIQKNPLKCAISFFLVEFISKVLKNQQQDKDLFKYIFQSIQILELMKNNYSNFHLVFTIKLGHWLGFYPSDNLYNKGMYFDLLNGIFVQEKPTHCSFLSQSNSLTFYNLLQINYKNMSDLILTGNKRSQIINQILNYYRLHCGYFFKMKSVKIFQKIFN